MYSPNRWRLWDLILFFLIRLSTTDHLDICTMWKERTGSLSRIYTLLHQRGKMLNTEWGDKTKVSSLDILARLKSSAVLTFGNVRVLHLCA